VTQFELLLLGLVSAEWSLLGIFWLPGRIIPDKNKRKILPNSTSCIVSLKNHHLNPGSQKTDRQFISFIFPQVEIMSDSVRVAVIGAGISGVVTLKNHHLNPGSQKMPSSDHSADTSPNNSNSN
jgi:hypothetical protein